MKCISPGLPRLSPILHRCQLFPPLFANSTSFTLAKMMTMRMFKFTQMKRLLRVRLMLLGFVSFDYSQLVWARADLELASQEGCQ